MIQSFKDRDTEQVFQGISIKAFSLKLCRQAQRKLLMIHAATNRVDLRVPLGNRLEKLRGEKNTFSIRINDQWRIRFVWRNGHAYNVEIIDYHS